MRKIWLWFIGAIISGLIFLWWPRRRIARNEAQLPPRERPAPVPYQPPAAQPVVAQTKTESAPHPKPEVRPKEQPKDRSKESPKEQPAKPPEDRVDDLTLLEGIGPKIAVALNAAGIKTYARLAALSPEEIERTVKAAGVRMVGHADSWPRQARLAAEGKFDELKAYQQTLRTSRKTSGHA